MLTGNKSPGILRSLVLISLSILVYVSVEADTRSGIVSLDLCTDWMLQRYAQSDQVKAYSPYLKQYSGPVKSDNVKSHDGSLEQIISLRPALVISGEYNAPLLRHRLRQLDYEVRVLSHADSLDDVSYYIDTFKAILGQLDPSSKPLSDMAYPIYKANGKTLLLLGANGIGTGRDTLEHDVLTAAGWENYVWQSGFVALQLEQVVHQPPDAIYSTTDHQRSIAMQFARHPALRQSIKHERLKGNKGWRWSCPGPWTYDLIEELATW